MRVVVVAVNIFAIVTTEWDLAGENLWVESRFGFSGHSLNFFETQFLHL